MATSANRAGARKTASRPTPAGNPSPQEAPAESAEAAPPAIDSTLDAWSSQAARESLSWQIDTCRALLRGAKAVREAQVQAAERAEASYLKAAEQLLSARSVADIGSLQLELLRANAEESLQHLTHLGELATRGWAETLQQAAEGWTRLGAAAWEGALQWSRWQASLPASADLVEAEMEHVTNPIAASPMVWPAQEATRQAMSLAAQTWNDWLGSLGSGASRPH